VAAQRLLILGAKWQKGPQGELYRDAEAVAYAVRVLTELLPGADAPVIFHKTPSLALLCLNRHELSRRLVALREGARRIPPLDVAATLNKDPRLVTSSDDARAIRETTRDVIDAVIDSVGFILDEQGVASVIETCPSILTAHRDDVADAFAGYKTELKTRLDGVKGWSSALLFALDEEEKTETSEKTRTKSSEINEKMPTTTTNARRSSNGRPRCGVRAGARWEKTRERRRRARASITRGGWWNRFCVAPTSSVNDEKKTRLMTPTTPSRGEKLHVIR
jgi:hypothetical protein